ncbi:MAG TPA: cytochrome c oxidase subunit 4, partial [Ilumatobacteraceae bacterium]|nr:cytochrome c oxidase subunit 4 [Ilumatobacteraceae bacterium]
AEEAAHADAHIHLPSPSYWPLVLAISLPVIAYGVIYSALLIAVGVAIAILALFGWALEPPTAADSDFDPPSSDGGQPSKELAHV